MPKIGGLKQTPLTPVPGVVSPSNQGAINPNKVGSQNVVKTPKSKKMPGADAKPSVFYGGLNKTEEKQVFKKKSIKDLNDFLTKIRAKKSQ